MRNKWRFRFASVACCLALIAGTSRAQTVEELSAESIAFMKSWVPAVAPAGLLKAGESAEVYVRFVVDEKGAVQSARVIDSPDARLDEAAVKAIKAWVFSPATKAGQPVACCLDLVMELSTTPKKPVKGSTLTRHC